VNVRVLNETTVQLSSLSVKRVGGYVEISGDVCNNGRSRVYNVMVVAGGKSYYIDYLDPSDFESFDMTIVANGTVKLTVSWMNGLGVKMEKVKVIRIPARIEKGSGTRLPLAISLLTLAAVISVIVLAWRRR